MLKKHKFFKGIEWDDLAALKVVQPIQPTVKGEGDASNFETYQEVEEEKVEVDPFRFIFKEF